MVKSFATTAIPICHMAYHAISHIQVSFREKEFAPLPYQGVCP